ncbi:hypothetical protein FOZ60_014474 [Perkinsus olseni]|uniref:Uncharacterized protein n=1 Tax=Perkinsus olseni TaxID=32597 RepID=A0A7J6N7C7_PEROL|nr:hypothetical protein FOZ60_014474 [Perkinsus olseni]
MGLDINLIFVSYMAEFDQDLQALVVSLKALDPVRAKLSELGINTIHLLTAIDNEDLTKAFSSEADIVATRTTSAMLIGQRPMS